MDSISVEEMGKAAELLQSIAKPAMNMIFEAIPRIIKFSRAVYSFYKKLPILYVTLIIGFVMCFFGGIYPTLFAALQAAEHSGLSTVKKALTVLSNEVMVIIEENKKDNATDADGDGVSDVDELSNREFIKRKTTLVLRKMDPEKVNAALSSLYKVWLSVMAVLSVEFARTIALALTISSFLDKFMTRVFSPILKRATPKEYSKWLPVIKDWFCKSIGMSIAWSIQTIVSAVSSAMAGGLIMSRCIMKIVAKEKDHNDTMADEIASYGFAAVGFYFQFYFGFGPPFPLNIFLLPLNVAEAWIRWSVTKSAGV